MKCFYHNDLDGRCAGAIVAHVMKNYNRDNFFEVDYRQVLPLTFVRERETVYFVDYSFTENTVWQLEHLVNELKCNVIWIDHHTSSIELMLNPDHSWLKSVPGTRDESSSGAMLTWLWFQELGQVPEFVRLVDDYDRWQFKMKPKTMRFKLGIELECYDALDPIWVSLIHEGTESKELLNQILSGGRVVETYTRQDNEQYLNTWSYESRITTPEGQTVDCLVVNRRTNSTIFGDLIKKYPAVVTWVFDGRKYTYSIFSADPTFYCNQVAEQYGGGGHKGAAGFTSDKLLFTYSEPQEV